MAQVQHKARVPYVEYEEAGERVRAVYDDMIKVRGRVANLFKAFANWPELLEVNWEKTKLLSRGGTLSFELKESMALLISEANNCTA
ncbi:MAG: hypothetical protein HYY21_02040 [Candidatus Tectomicrobia bacterium]|nr:hypothetical protein [Candidatus Tectomicrobia bacterium]